MILKYFPPHEKYIVPIKSPSIKQHDIDVFTGDGRHVLKLSDKEVTSTMFTRATSNITKIVNTENSTVATQIKVDLDYIKLPISIYSHRHLNIPDPIIGTLDL